MNLTMSNFCFKAISRFQFLRIDYEDHDEGYHNAFFWAFDPTSPVRFEIAERNSSGCERSRRRGCDREKPGNAVQNASNSCRMT